MAVADSAASPQAHRAATQIAALGDQLFVLKQPGRVVIMWPAPRSGRDNRQLLPDAAGLGAVSAAAATAYEICQTRRPGENSLVTLAQHGPA